MYERQTPELKYIEGIGDYDGNGIQDMFGRRHDGPRSYFMFNVFSPEAYSFGFEQGVNVPNTK